VTALGWIAHHLTAATLARATLRSLHAASAEALQGRNDPALLLGALGALRAAYAHAHVQAGARPPLRMVCGPRRLGDRADPGFA
jgi:hypothetical protein